MKTFRVLSICAGLLIAPTGTALADKTGADPAAAKVSAFVDIAQQRMHVYVGNVLTHVWKVSTGRGSYVTPAGTYQPEWLSPRHRSRKYNLAPMPWSVFYYKGYAVHGTTDVKRLGRPASHGCVRLLTANAKKFFQLVREHGMENTVISVVRSVDPFPEPGFDAPTGTEELDAGSLRLARQ